MSQNHEANDNQSLIADLATGEAEAEAIKGGPKRIFIGGLSVADAQLGDLEPRDEVKGGAIRGQAQTMVNNTSSI